MPTTLRSVFLLALGTGLISTLGFRSAPPASVAKDFACAVLESDHGVAGIGDLITAETHSVVTSSGNSSVTCHFRIPAGFEPRSAVHGGGFACLTHGGLTFDSRSVATPGGSLTMTCRGKAGAE